MKRLKKSKKDEIYNDSWIYMLLLTTLTILLESLKTYTFSVKGTVIKYSIILLPLIYFVANYIAKKYGFKKALASIVLSAAFTVLYVIVMSFALRQRFILYSITGELCGYIASQMVNLTIYMFLLNNTKSPAILVFINYVFALVVFYMFYTIIYLNMIILDNFWAEYFTTLGIQTIICIPITIFDKKIKRGLEIIK